MTTQPNSVPEVVTQWVSHWLTTQWRAKTAADFELTRLKGDGSQRCFYRLRCRPASGSEQSFILLHDPSWKASQAYAPHQQFLEEQAILVPQFMAVDPKQGFLLMEDLGDELLQMRIEKNPQEKLDWLKRSIKVLANLHGKTCPVPAQLPGSRLRFDAAKYLEELNHTHLHLHCQLLGFNPWTDSQKDGLRTFCTQLEKIAPWVLCHRDYHTRNLLLYKEALYLIDFQDARVGPPHYDVASLLYDAYIDLSESEITDLQSTYRKAVSDYALADEIQWDRWQTDLELIAIQRTLKAAGSFASFFTRFKKKTHLRYLEPALETSKQLLSKHPTEIAALFPIDSYLDKLAKMPELRSCS